jgi:hypothetical protein
MKDLLLLIAHLLTTIAKLLAPGGIRALVAESRCYSNINCSSSTGHRDGVPVCVAGIAFFWV